VLTFAAPALAEVALKFSSFEFFWLACLGLSCAVFISRGSVVKSLISLLLGLLIATVGVDIISGHPRFTFGSVELMGGVSFIPAMIGMFAVPEIIRFASERRLVLPQQQATVSHVFRGIGTTLRRYKFNVLRGSVLGTAIGILPGAGADIAAWIAYATSKKMSKTPEKFGQGHVEGLVDAGSANNAALGGAWVPAMVFGIPGDSVTAIVIGVLYMKGMNPGPTVFLNRPDLVYAVFAVFILANLILLPFGYVLIRLARHILRVPRRALMPVILLFCVVGSFAINNTVFGVSVMLVLGIIAFIMEENDIPVAPAILGIVLGPLLEGNFITSMIKADGSYLAFFERPIAATLGIITFAIWLLPPLLRLLRERNGKHVKFGI
jgi:TctA family transporter